MIELSIVNSMLPLAGVVAGVVFALLLAPIVFRETRRVRAIDRRLATPRGQAVTSTPSRRSPDRLPSLARTGRWGLAVLRLGSMLVPVGAGEREKLAQLLRNGGFGQSEALSIFLSAKLASSLSLGAGVGLWAASANLFGGHAYFVAMTALAGLVVGGILPEYPLRNLAARRARRMAAALPDALDMMVMCLGAGLTVERAILTVAETLAPIERNLAKEFRQIEAELRLAADRRAMLEEYYRRTEIDGLRDFAMVLIQSDRYGTPLSEAMKAIAADERLQKAARIAAQAERLPVLLTLPMLLFVVPGTVLLVAGPAFLTAIRALDTLGG